MFRMKYFRIIAGSRCEFKALTHAQHVRVEFQ